LFDALLFSEGWKLFFLVPKFLEAGENASSDSLPVFGLKPAAFRV
jgi:hypothetical protein